MGYYSANLCKPFCTDFSLGLEHFRHLEYPSKTELALSGKIKKKQRPGVHSMTSPLYPVSSSNSRNAALSAVSFSSMSHLLTCRKFQAIAVNWGPELTPVNDRHTYQARPSLSPPVSREGLSFLQRLFGSHGTEPPPTLLSWINHVPLLLPQENHIPSPYQQTQFTSL
uniref:Uncharacterized protein n=1 Tax=Buteo japonicus TaxID=224669 RepID=A0A8C0BY14_9AVES